MNMEGNGKKIESKIRIGSIQILGKFNKTIRFAHMQRILGDRETH